MPLQVVATSRELYGGIHDIESIYHDKKKRLLNICLEDIKNENGRLYLYLPVGIELESLGM